VDVRREQCLQTPPAEAQAVTAEAKAKAKSKASEETHKRPKVSKVCREGVNGRES